MVGFNERHQSCSRGVKVQFRTGYFAAHGITPVRRVLTDNGACHLCGLMRFDAIDPGAVAAGSWRQRISVDPDVISTAATPMALPGQPYRSSASPTPTSHGSNTPPTPATPASPSPSSGG